jgi:tetratricopeptide (TPR) repeat protein
LTASKGSTYILIFNAHLIISLHTLSNCLSNLGHRESALPAIREVVEPRRQLAKEWPVVYDADLADFLNNLSNRLLNLSHRGDAFAAIRGLPSFISGRQRIDLKYTIDLAGSLNNLSGRLSHQDALAALQPPYHHLSKLGHLEGALAAIRDAIKLYRQLENDRPAAHNANLMLCLKNLSVRLSDLGHRDEAPNVNREIVKLRGEQTIACRLTGCIVVSYLTR